MNNKFLGLLILFSISVLGVFAQLKIDKEKTVEYLVKEVLLSSDDNKLVIENITYRGSSEAISLFTNMSSNLLPSNIPSSNLLFVKGVVLSTGKVDDVLGPNKSERKTGIFNSESDESLNDILEKGVTTDAAVLEFDFIPQTDSISFYYMFGSEEYNEYVGEKYNDVFGFFVSGPGIVGERNLAVLPNKHPVTVNSINYKLNPEYFIDNKTDEKEYEDMYSKNSARLSHVLQFDGVTVPLKAECKVIPNKKYHIKIAIADVADPIFDSGVFLQAGSFKSSSTTTKEELKVIEEDEEVLLIDIPETKDISYTIEENEVNIIMNIEFDNASYVIPDSSFKLIDVVYNILQDNSDFRLEVQGHTNNVGSDEYNQTLSEQRAKAIFDYLIASGVARNRMSFKGFGPSKPIKSNDTEEGRAANRRVEFLLQKTK